MIVQTEGQAQFYAPTGKISKKLPVFYNPVMEFNRNTTIGVCNIYNPQKIALPMAGTGIRGLRILMETSVKNVSMNDMNPVACELIEKNLNLNKLSASTYCMDASLFLMQSKGFDYIDIDPFGSPNVFLDAAIRSIKNKGILAVTATDTAPLCGTYVKACRRKYWANPLRNEEMHEIGLRILIRKVQLVAAQYEKAAIPVFSYYRHHYFRIYFRMRRGKQRADELLKQHNTYKEAGPMWLGQLWDSKIAEKLALPDDNFLKTIAAESHVDSVGFYDIHTYAKKLKLPTIPKLADILSQIPGTRTHFCPTGIRSKITEEKFIQLLCARQ